MIENKYLTQTERDKLLLNLNKKQKEFFHEYLRRGRKTAFANVLARDKAAGVDEASITEVAQEWEFQDFIDAGPGWRADAQLFCECGRALRYQYVVFNNQTKEVKKFGITHFEEHIGIPAHLVKEIINGIVKIDYEGDEILIKIANGWTLADEQIFEIPIDVTIPNDIQFHFDNNVPLLNRQITALKRLIADYLRDKEEERLHKERMKIKEETEKKKLEVSNLRKKKLQSQIWDYELGISAELQAGIMVYLDSLYEPQFLASDVCDYLITYHDASNERYSSGSYKIFSHVCIFLEKLIPKGKLEFIGRRNGIDREYKLLES
ncbi:DUF3895 domain-containing protein [Oceanobacillus sp. CAU 1775]